MILQTQNNCAANYIELDQNKVEDIITKNGGVNAAVDPAEVQAQEMANAEPAAAPAA